MSKDEQSKVIKRLERAIKRIEALEDEINELRRKGLYPGNPGDPIPID